MISPARHLRQVALLLRLRAEGVNRVHDERPLHAREAPDARVAALELLHREAVADLAQPRAAVPLKVAAEEAELGDLGDQLHGERPLFEVLSDGRQDARIDEGANGVAHGALFGGEVAGEVEEVGHGGVRA